MRAIVLSSANGGADDMQITDVAEPVPSADEVLLDVAFGGCNFADTMMRIGTYPHPKGYPLVAGIEVAGRIAACGPHVEGFAAGDRVAVFIEEAGGFADRCVAPAERLVRLPDGVGLDQGAAFYIQALTAWHLLHNISQTTRDETLLVHAIGGGVGLYLTQLAVRAGAKVIGTVGTAGKEQRALDYGASAVINRSEEDFVEAVRKIVGAQGIDKLIDSTGATILDKSFALMKKLGHVVSYGEAEGRPLENLWEQLVAKSLTFSRFHLGHVNYSGALWQQSVEEVVNGVADGSIQVPIEGVFDFEDIESMYSRLLSRQVAGKLLLAINPSLN